MRRLLLPLCAAILTAACAAGPGTMEGKWIQPIPGQENHVQGFALHADGSAQSINMATLLYKSWRTQGDTLVLYGQSIGNGQTIAFSKTYTFSFPDKNTLLLSDENGAEMTFSRQP